MKAMEFVAIASLAVAAAQAKEVGVFQPPSLDGYTLVETKLLDKSDPPDGVKETTGYKYQRGNDSIIGLNVTNGRLWAVVVINKVNDKHDAVSNFVLIDSRCRGVFDEKIDAATVYYMPDCVTKEGR